MEKSRRGNKRKRDGKMLFRKEVKRQREKKRDKLTKEVREVQNCTVMK